MYNGIGVSTARGTATNGYVQRNIAYRRQGSSKHEVEEFEAPKVRKPNKDILEHQRKRLIEVKLLEWAEENNIYDKHSEDEAENIIAEQRIKFTKLQEKGLLDSNKDGDLHDSHQRSAAKEKEIERFRKAMRIDKDYETGAAFNEDYQQLKKEQRYEKKLEYEKKKYLREKEEKELRKQYERERRERRDRRPSRSPPRYRDRRSPSPRGYGYRRYRSPSPRNRSPPYERRRSGERRRSPSPPYRRREDSFSPKRRRSRPDDSLSPVNTRSPSSPSQKPHNLSPKKDARSPSPTEK